MKLLLCGLLGVSLVSAQVVPAPCAGDTCCGTFSGNKVVGATVGPPTRNATGGDWPWNKTAGELAYENCVASTGSQTNKCWCAKYLFKDAQGNERVAVSAKDNESPSVICGTKYSIWTSGMKADVAAWKKMAEANPDAKAFNDAAADPVYSQVKDDACDGIDCDDFDTWSTTHQVAVAAASDIVSCGVDADDENCVAQNHGVGAENLQACKDAGCNYQTFSYFYGGNGKDTNSSLEYVYLDCASVAGFTSAAKCPIRLTEEKQIRKKFEAHMCVAAGDSNCGPTGEKFIDYIDMAADIEQVCPGAVLASSVTSVAAVLMAYFF